MRARFNIFPVDGPKNGTAWRPPSFSPAHDRSPKIAHTELGNRAARLLQLFRRSHLLPRHEGPEAQTPPMPPTLYPLSRSPRTIQTLRCIGERLFSSSQRPQAAYDHFGRGRDGLSFVVVADPRR